MPILRNRTLPWYLSVAAILAISRVALFLCASQKDLYLLWGLYPESLLGSHTRLGLFHFEHMEYNVLFWAGIFVLGSFLLATPILLAGRLMARRRL